MKTKILLFLGFWWLLGLYYTGDIFGPGLVEAQGVGLRCDTPRCRYAPIYRGRWAGDGRHDYSPYGPYGYGGDYAPDALYSRDGVTIVNPSPGTNLKVEKKSGGFLCIVPLLNLFCTEEKIDFSTAPAAGQVKPQP